MANEVSLTNNADLRIASVLNQEVWQLTSDKVDLRSTCYRIPAAGVVGTLAVKVPQVLFNDIMAAIGEVTDVPPNALENDTVTVTAARQALRYDPSDEFLISGGNTGPAELANGLALGYVRRASEMITTLYPSFTAVAGDTTVALTVDDIYDASFDLEKADVSGTSPNCVLSPKQFTDFQSSLRGEGGAIQFVPATADMLANKGQGFKGTWNGINFFTSSQVTDDGTDYYGAMYLPGGIVLLEMPVEVIRTVIPTNAFLSVAVAGSSMWVEIQRDASKGLTEMVGNGYLGVALNEDGLGVEIRSAV